MRSRIPIFYSALLLTAVNLLLRFAGTSFQVYLSSRIGAAGIGILQLVMSVGGLASVAGMAGIRTATMYLTAEELGKQQPGNIAPVLSACFLYSFCCSSAVALLLYSYAPFISTTWIGKPETIQAIRFFAAFLPVVCLCGVMTGYFTAANRIGTLAAVEVCEQLLSMGITLYALSCFPSPTPTRACQCILMGSGISSCLTLFCLMLLRLSEPKYPSGAIRLQKRLMHTAVPLAFADILKAGINTLENITVPKRLALNVHVADPLSAFGTVSGMVFPVLMFPTCILYGLAELLVPELARCNAAGNTQRTHYLVRRSLRITLLYAAFFAGLMFLLAENLCIRLYNSTEAGRYLKGYALLIPMLYCDAITDAMTKGLGQQKICVRYNILTSAMDVAMLYVLLPKYGMHGYFFSFLISHFVNFMLSLRRLLKIAKETLSLSAPTIIFTCAFLSCLVCSKLRQPLFRAGGYIAVLLSLLILSGTVRSEDLDWIRGLTKRKPQKIRSA